MAERVFIVPYDKHWAELFAAERNALLKAIGQYVTAIEHAGSTAVPGLAAKPVIDILVGLRSLSDTPALLAPMATLDYEYHPEFESGLPERRYFKKPAGSDRHTHHIHMTEVTANFWREHLLFRDYLRAHPEAMRTYAQLKQELAVRYVNDRDQYTNAKADFIQEILRLAKEESAI